MIHYDLAWATLFKLFSFLCWCYLYLWFIVVQPGESPEWYSRAVTLIHGSVATIMGFNQCGMTTLARHCFERKVTMPEYSLMLFTWGYFAFDFIWCLEYYSENYLILGHHLIALLGVTVYLNKPYSGNLFSCTILLMEFTNPLLQTRWFLKNSQYKKSVGYYVVEITYLFLFVMARAVLGTYIILRILPSDLFDLESKLISLGLYAVSVGLLYEIFGYIYYKYKHHFNGILDLIDGLGYVLNIYR